ncbi:MAG: hypothetical protein AAF449_01580 [Myxococcota bacterium]
MAVARSNLTRMLVVVFVIQTIGFAGLVVRQGTPVGSLMFSSGWLSEPVSSAVDGGFAAVLVVCSLILSGGPRSWTVIAGGVAGFVMLCLTLADAVNGGHFGAELAPAAHAVRWVVPAVLAGLAIGWPAKDALRTLRIAAGAVFVAHGVECLRQHPGFVDFLVTVPETYLSVSLSQGQAVEALLAIGVLDVVVGLAMAVIGGPVVAGWMAFWGLMTAAVRLLYFGGLGWPDALVRVANGGVPLIILIVHWLGRVGSTVDGEDLE